jgi:hypothetical protein
MKLLYTTLCVLVCLYTSATTPTVPASNLSFNIIEGSYLNVSWRAGNGTRRIMIVKAGSPVTAVPQNGIDYQENTNFGSGQAIAPGEYVVYDNAFTSFYLTGLAPATQYYFAVYEYNGTGVNAEYLTSSFLQGNGATVSTPTIQASNITFSNITGNTVIINCTPGNGARRLIVAREGSPVNADPVDLTSYGAHNNFGSGATIGAGNYSVYGGSGSNVLISNLKSGTTYHFAVFEFNGVGEPVYKLPGVVNSMTTRTIPTIPASNIITTVTDGKELAFSWTSGNGERRIIVAKQTSAVSGAPANGTDYAANDIFGTGPTIAPGEYVVYDGTGNGAYVYGLNPATTYHFKIFEYDGAGNNTLYLTGLYASTSAATAAVPATQATSLAASAITPVFVNLSFTKGSGRGRFIVARKDAAVDVVPQHFTTYAANADFGSGQQLGNGNYVISYSLNEGVIINNLQPNTTYHFAAFEFNGINQPLYLAPPATFSFTTPGLLPVKLTGWKALRKEDKVQLQWTTQTEINSSRFEIERSDDGASFTVAATVNAKGNSQLPVDYTWTDIQSLTGKSYYRLKMIDKDNQFEYSPVLTVPGQDADKVIKLLTNPVREKLVADLTAFADKNHAWSIVNVHGQSVATGIIKAARLEVNTSTFPTGSYWLCLQSAGNKLQMIPFLKH